MRKFLFVLAVLSLSACAHHRDVRPGPNGLNRVLVKTDNTDEGSRDAIAQANHYCDQFGKHAVFMEEKQSYTGTMKESDYRKAKTAAKVAQGVGGAAWVFGGQKESNVGGIVGLGGGIADGALGNGYAVDMQFRCQ
ncbi:MAG: hypothetical protein KF802_03220 [Bdellovibrionaceae bacterium]|nr:hypothetical protein [Pseudobdellovibrionaceae bacterium]